MADGGDSDSEGGDDDKEEHVVSVVIKFSRHDVYYGREMDASKVMREIALSKEQRFLTQFGRGEFHTVKHYGTTFDPTCGTGLVMEYVGGGDLKTWLCQYNPSKNPLVNINLSILKIN